MDPVGSGMKVGILGSGDVARALGHGFLAGGHEVKLGSRDPKNAPLTEWCQKAGARASHGSFRDAAKFGEVLVLATRGTASPEVLRSAGTKGFEGKVVIDVTNPLIFAPDAPPSLALGHTTSAGEELQKRLPKSRVVKAFNIVGNAHFYRPEFPGGSPTMFLCGNDAGAKQTVRTILTEFGWPNVVDVGGIEGSRELESLCILWVKSALARGSWNIAFGLLEK
jgi:8-hydroxy-5-deazaflavin:NADPH oxidoreductase